MPETQLPLPKTLSVTIFNASKFAKVDLTCRKIVITPDLIRVWTLAIEDKTEIASIYTPFYIPMKEIIRFERSGMLMNDIRITITEDFYRESFASRLIER